MSALSAYVAAVDAGAADPRRSRVPADLGPGPLWRSVRGEHAPTLEPRIAGIFVNAWSSMLGFLAAEIFGPISRLIDATDRLYDAHLRTTMLGMGFREELVDALTA